MATASSGRPLDIVSNHLDRLALGVYGATNCHMPVDFVDLEIDVSADSLPVFMAARYAEAWVKERRNC